MNDIVQQSALKSEGNLSRRPPKLEEVKRDEENPSLGIGEDDTRRDEGTVMVCCPKEEENEEECVPDMSNILNEEASRSKVLLINQYIHVSCNGLVEFLQG